MLNFFSIVDIYQSGSKLTEDRSTADMGHREGPASQFDLAKFGVLRVKRVCSDGHLVADHTV